MRQLTLLFRGPGGPSLAATFIETASNGWIVQVEDGKERIMEHFLLMVGLYRLQRPVRPDEGELYYEALRETFGRSSGLLLVETEIADA